MDIILRGVTQHAMNYAVRSGIAMTASFAIRQCGRLLEDEPEGEGRAKLTELQGRLEDKIKILSPAIEMIDLISARGNTSLECARGLTKQIRSDMQALGKRLCKARLHGETSREANSDTANLASRNIEIQAIIYFIQTLLVRIDDAIPLINLAITTSGVNLSTSLSGTVSPSRLLQASAFLTAADSKYVTSPHDRHQVGPTYILSLYALFAGHASGRDSSHQVHSAIWKEVIHKAHVKLYRIPAPHKHEVDEEKLVNDDTSPMKAPTSKYSYEVVFVEDLDDNRVHENAESDLSDIEGISNAGIRDVVPVAEISKILYADTGKLLQINSDSDSNNPVLILKRDIPPLISKPRSYENRHHWSDTLHGSKGEVSDDADESCAIYSSDEQSSIDAQLHREIQYGGASRHAQPAGWPKVGGLPPDLDPEWLAFEVYTDDDLDDSDSGETDDDSAQSAHHVESDTFSIRDKLSADIASMALRSMDGVTTNSARTSDSIRPIVPRRVQTSLSLFEMTLKLAALQQFRQETHLAIEDELLNFFLESYSTIDAGSDKTQRRHARRRAASRVGFDPYGPSPVKPT